MAENTFTDKNIDRVRNIHHGNFLDYLSSAYEVLKKIFSYLSLEDLDIVSEAFDKWKPVVETTKRERTAIDSFILSFKYEDCKMRSEASFCITFSMVADKKLDEKLQKHLRENAQFIMVKSRAGIIGTPCDYSQIVQEKKLKFSYPPADTPIATHLRIPSFSGVGIKTFVWYEHISFDDFRDSFSLPENEVIKCLIILTIFKETNSNACEQKDHFLFHLLTSQKESFAVGGCLVDSFPNDPDAVTKYIVFHGENVDAASLVLEQNVQTQEKIESKVAKFESMCPKTDKGIVFVFSCCSRHKVSRLSTIRKNLITWEAEALMKHFSSTPIVGCFGYGEFGRNFPEKEGLKSLSKRAKARVIWEYSFSTSIVYIGFKK